MFSSDDEAVKLLSCVALGFVSFWAFGNGISIQQRGKRRQFKCSAKDCEDKLKLSKASDGTSCSFVASALPEENCAEVARFLDLVEIAAVGAASVSTQQHFWHAPQVWRALAARCKQTLTSPSCEFAALALPQSTPEAFRRTLFRLDGERLLHLGVDALGAGGAGHAAVLVEAHHMVCGIMPCDGETILEVICMASEKALQAHDAADKQTALVADIFLQAVRKRADVFETKHLDRLESAYNSALQLQVLMEAAMQKDIEQYELQSINNSNFEPDFTAADGWQMGFNASTNIVPWGSPLLVPDIIMDSALEEMLEMQFQLLDVEQ